MRTRKEKIQELMESLRPLKRQMALRSGGTLHAPRITPAQWEVLMLIEEHGRLTVRETAAALGITSSAATQLTSGLIGSGYVERSVSHEDRRVAFLALSKDAKAHIADLKKTAIQKLLKLFEALSDAEFDQYLQLNKKLAQPYTKKYDFTNR